MLAPVELFGNLAYLLVVISFVVRDVFWLRVSAIDKDLNQP